MAVRFATYNVRGLRDNEKRVAIFKQIINSNFSVIALQETHCTSDVKEQWKDEWPGVSEWSIGPSDSAGVAILFHPKLDAEIINLFEPIPSRIMRLNVKLGKNKLQVLNIYGPTSNSKGEADLFFYEANKSLSFDPPPVILGDFNMVENLSLDRKGGTNKSYHRYGFLEKLVELIDDCDVVQ